MKNNSNCVLVTGAGKGIGYATVKYLLEKKYFVFALVKNSKDNNNFKPNKNLKIFNGDVQNLKLIKKIFFKANQSKKTIRFLVNNAGIRQRIKFLKIKKKDIYKVFNINFFSIFNLMQIFTNNLIKKKLPGSIVNISSIVGKTGFDELSGYSSTKGALSSLTRCFAKEMVNFKIRANCISPGFTETSYFEKFKKKRKLYNWTLNKIPMHRWGKPDEIAKLIGFLLSDDSSYINGEDVNIDGGWLSS